MDLTLLSKVRRNQQEAQVFKSHKSIEHDKTMYGKKNLETRILRVLHIAIHCPLPAAKIRGPKILEDIN